MTRLIVTIDTEEEGLWSGRYRQRDNAVTNVCNVGRFQSLCDRLGIRPTYLVDAPVVQDDDASATLAEIHRSGRCEIGTHVHPWCNPPCDESPCARNSYLCNLPESLQRAKIEWLTDAIQNRFGARPTSFRAGRYGLDIVGARILSELGYIVDSSVIPFTDASTDGGPDFRNAPFRPYYVDNDQLTLPHAKGFLLEVPVSVGYHWSDFRRAHAIRQFAGDKWIRKLRAVGVVDRLGIGRRIKFSPEQATAAQMKRLADNYVRLNASALVMLFHSTSLTPGFSPYVRTERELEQFFGRLETALDHCLEHHGMAPATLSQFAEHETRVLEHAS